MNGKISSWWKNGNSPTSNPDYCLKTEILTWLSSEYKASYPKTKTNPPPSPSSSSKKKTTSVFVSCLLTRQVREEWTESLDMNSGRDYVLPSQKQTTLLVSRATHTCKSIHTYMWLTNVRYNVRATISNWKYNIIDLWQSSWNISNMTDKSCCR